jgi:hypothetical protein
MLLAGRFIFRCKITPIARTCQLPKKVKKQKRCTFMSGRTVYNVVAGLHSRFIYFIRLLFSNTPQLVGGADDKLFAGDGNRGAAVFA